MKRVFAYVSALILTGMIPAFASGTPSWVNVTNGLPAIGVIATAPGKDRVIAGASDKSGLRASNDGGATWTNLGSGGGFMTSCIRFDTSASDTFWVCGIYGTPVIVTRDGGTTFKEMGSISHNDALAVDLNDPLRRTVLVSGHEAKKTLNKTLNDGANWTNIGANLPDSSHFSAYPHIFDSLTYIVGCSGWGGGSAGIWRTSDGGTSWTQVSKISAFGYPLVCKNGDIYFNIIWDNGLVRSTDGGNRWLTAVGFGTVLNCPPIELPDGRIVASSSKTNASGLIVSSNKGASWTDLGPRTAGKVNSITYNIIRKALFVSCGNSGVFRLDYDYTVDAKLPVANASIPKNLQTTFTFSGDRFTIPANCVNCLVMATFYSANGRILGKISAKAGQTISLSGADATGFTMAKLAPVSTR
jgi:hypothetical protein